MPVNFSQLLLDMVKVNASDLHLKTGAVPVYRINGELIPVDHPPLKKEEIAAFVEKIIPERHKKTLEEMRSVDFGFSIDPINRFRTNVFYQRGTLSVAMRRLQYEHLGFEELNLPPIIKTIGNYKRGMVLVTGPTGTGKSTTMAALVDYINSTRREHIITIEDPIEFIHKDKMSLVEQREIGVDAVTFERALRDAMRSDPDVILIGEMRDKDTITIAVRAAMTGHLVISTLHTINAVQTVNRIINYFDPDEQPILRDELATALRAVVAQRLVPRGDGKGRVPCVEIMIVNDMVRKLMRENRIADIEQVIRNAVDGMQSFDMSLVDLVKRGMVSVEVGLEYAEDVPRFKRQMVGIVAGDDRSRILSEI
ncbi:MAG: PilT/PilU family type 4a pilus ATPase [Candidatus Sumerlaeia bacterium]|nr:PilT/PilU family type 4a pilus ATPase [Candidatus Sumerlaeia bacterium]